MQKRQKPAWQAASLQPAGKRAGEMGGPVIQHYPPARSFRLPKATESTRDLQLRAYDKAEMLDSWVG